MFAEELHLVFACSVVLNRRSPERALICMQEERRERQQKQVSEKDVAHEGLEWKNAGFPSTLM